MSCLSCSRQGCNFLTQWNVKWQMPSPCLDFWMASLTWALCTSGGRSSLRHTTNSASWCDLIEKRNVMWSESQLVTSLYDNATPYILKTHLHSSFQEAAVQVEINILTWDLQRHFSKAYLKSSFLSFFGNWIVSLAYTNSESVLKLPYVLPLVSHCTMVLKESVHCEELESASSTATAHVCALLLLIDSHSTRVLSKLDSGVTWNILYIHVCYGILFVLF